MDTEMNPPCYLRSARNGLTLIELITAMVAALIVMITAGVLLYGGQRSWLKTYNDNNCESRVGALNTMIALGALGRKSNRMNYRLYEVDGDNFEPVLPAAEPEEVVIGQAVEFRYWNDELDADLMNKDITATAYALFYLEGDELKIDFGPFPPGGVSEAGRRITGDGITTVSLVKHVAIAEFSHTTRDMAGDGKGCVRMKLNIDNSVDGSPQTVLAATLMRNTWP